MKIITLSLTCCFALHAVELPPLEVSSTKVDETLVQSSSTVNSIDTLTAKNFGLKNISDLSSVSANTNISGLGDVYNKTFTFRGISNYLCVEPSVAIYLDDAPLSSGYAYGAINMNDISKIEVLKGAQGTDFGKSAESGVINISTKPTSKKFEMQAKLSFGEYNAKEFYGRVNQPLSDSTAFAFSMTKKSSEGYVKNLTTGADFDKRDYLGINSKLSYSPNSNFSAQLSYTRTQNNDGGTPFTMNTQENRETISNDPINDFTKMDNDILSLVMKYKTDTYKITSATSYNKQLLENERFTDIFGGFVMDFNTQIQEVSEELRVNYLFENFDFQIGAFYSQKNKFDYSDKEVLLALPLLAPSKNNLSNPDKVSALFTQFKYYMGENFSILTGLRYEKTQRDFTRDLQQFGYPSATNVQISNSWSYWLPKISIAYDTDLSHTYLTYTKGYRAGGYNYRIATQDLISYKPEITDSFEVGDKRNIIKNLTLHSAVFYNFIDSLRINTLNDTLISTLYNAQKAHSYGGELELAYKTDLYSLYTTAGFTQTKITQFDSNPQYNNKQIIDVPDMTFAIGGSYNFMKNYYFDGSMKYMGKRYYNASNTQADSGYAITNIGLGYKKDGWDLLCYADNLFDRKYVDFMIATPSNNYYHFGMPRVVGVSIAKTF